MKKELNINGNIYRLVEEKVLIDRAECAEVTKSSELELKILTRIAHKKGLIDGVECITYLMGQKIIIKEPFSTTEIYGSLMDSNWNIIYHKATDKWAEIADNCNE